MDPMELHRGSAALARQLINQAILNNCIYHGHTFKKRGRMPNCANDVLITSPSNSTANGRSAVTISDVVDQRSVFGIRPLRMSERANWSISHLFMSRET